MHSLSLPRLWQKPRLLPDIPDDCHSFTGDIWETTVGAFHVSAKRWLVELWESQALDRAYIMLSTGCWLTAVCTVVLSIWSPWWVSSQSSHFVTLSICHSVTLSLCHCVTVSLCHFVTLSICHYVNMSLCHYVIMSLCHFVHRHSVTMSLCHSVTLSLCHFVTMSLCHSVTLLHHHSVTM